MATVVSPIPDHIAKAIRRIGPNFNPDIRAEILGLYDEIHSARPARGARVVPDQQYGPGDRNVLDIHSPPGDGTAPLPVIVFFHGGGFIEGHKSIGAGNIFANIADAFTARGFVVVNATYHLAPEAPWPQGGTQIGLAAEWVQANIARFGGDPDRVFLMGHSAGGTHLASFVYHDALRDGAPPPCIGVVLVSVTTDVADIGIRPNVAAYYGDNPDQYAGMATVRNIAAISTPVMVINAEFDPAFFIEQAGDFVATLRRETDIDPVRVMIPGHNHVSEIYHIGTDDDSIASQIVEFCLSVSA